jgi:dTDP-3-amino-3,4,6-trideoxy-alpha-D-glucose transaminase
MIPILDLKRQIEAIRPELDSAIARVMDRGQFILGPEVEEFERSFASYCGTGYAVGVGSGTEALQVALSACGIGPGDEVITVAHTSVATVAAVEMAGARPVLVDIDPSRLTMDPEQIQDAVTARTRAILPVHLYGNPADLAPILEFADLRGLAVIEDCAHAHGALYRGKRVGSWGRLAAFSFYPTKNLGGYGDGGAVVTGDPVLAGRVRQIRQYGWDENRISQRTGINSRLDEIQAALLATKLKYLDAWNEERRSLAAGYDRGLSTTGLTIPKSAPDSVAVYYAYVVRHPRRDSLRAFLAERGIQTLIRYPVPIHLQPAYQHLNQGAGSLPASEAAARETLALPLFPGMRGEEQQQVIDAVKEFIAQAAGSGSRGS